MKNLLSTILIILGLQASGQEASGTATDSTAVAKTIYLPVETAVDTNTEIPDETPDGFNGYSHIVDGKEVKCNHRHPGFFMPIKRIQADQLNKVMSGSTF